MQTRIIEIPAYLPAHLFSLKKNNPKWHIDTEALEKLFNNDNWFSLQIPHHHVPGAHPAVIAKDKQHPCILIVEVEDGYENNYVLLERFKRIFIPGDQFSHLNNPMYAELTFIPDPETKEIIFNSEVLGVAFDNPYSVRKQLQNYLSSALFDVEACTKHFIADHFKRYPSQPYSEMLSMLLALLALLKHGHLTDQKLHEHCQQVVKAVEALQEFKTEFEKTNFVRLRFESLSKDTMRFKALLENEKLLQASVRQRSVEPFSPPPRKSWFSSFNAFCSFNTAPNGVNTISCSFSTPFAKP